MVILAGWINPHQQAVIEYQSTQTQVLLEKLGKKRILLDADQRCRFFTPDTILRWHRQLVAEKWNYNHRRNKKLRTALAVSEEVRRLVLRMAQENPTRGYDRIQGALANLGHEISDQTVGGML